MHLLTHHLSRFDLVSIRLLVDCVQHGSLTAAAERAHLALPAASRRIKELEQAVGVALFVRQGRRLQVTRAGRVFYRHGVAVLQSMELLGLELTQAALGALIEVRLSASTAAISQTLSPILREHARAFPRVRVELEEQVSEGVVTALREGRADVGVFVEGQDTHGLDWQPFAQDRLVLVLPAAHRLAGDTPIAFDEALDEEWISFTDGAAVLGRQYQAAHAAGRVLRLRMQVRSFDTACHLVAAGMGIAMLPAAAVRIARGMGLCCRPLADAWASRRMLVATRSAAASAEADALVEFIVHSSRTAKRPRDKTVMDGALHAR